MYLCTNPPLSLLLNRLPQDSIDFITFHFRLLVYSYYANLLAYNTAEKIEDHLRSRYFTGLLDAKSLDVEQSHKEEAMYRFQPNQNRMKYIIRVSDLIQPPQYKPTYNVWFHGP